MLKRSTTHLLTVFVIITAFLCFGKTDLWADDGVLGMTPDGIYPITQADITMEAEEIYIKMIGEVDAQVTCRFDFINFGPAQTVLMGFPAKLGDSTDDLTTPEDITVRNFTAQSNKNSLPVTLIETIPDPPLIEHTQLAKYSQWYSFSVDFGANEKVTLYHTYEISFPHDSMGFTYMGYVLETGAVWKGPIGHAKVIFDMGNNPMYTLTQAYPNNFYRMEGTKLIWERNDFEPFYNLWITKNSLHYSEQWQELCRDYGYDYNGKEIENRITLFNTKAATLRKNSQQYYESYQNLIFEDPIAALYIKSALGLPHGSGQPEITDCRVVEHAGGFWRFEIGGIDADGDLVGCAAKIDGAVPTAYVADLWRGQLFYDKEKKHYCFSSYLSMDKPSESFYITFLLTDAFGNMDTKTLPLTAQIHDNQGPEEENVLQTPKGQNPEPPTPKNESYSGVIDTKEISKAAQPARVIPMEEGMKNLLTTVMVIVFLLFAMFVFIIFKKTGKKGYLFFNLQALFAAFGIYQVTDLLNLTDATHGVMISEEITLRIGLIAMIWIFSIGCIPAGLITLEKDKRNVRVH